MVAPVLTKELINVATQSKAARFADAAEAAGWTVERKKGELGERFAHCTRGTEKVNMEWAPVYGRGTSALVFSGGWHWVDDDPEHAVEITNVTAMLREMAKPPKHTKTDTDGAVVRLPFDPVNDTDADIIDALKGKTITWRRKLDGETMDDRIPPYTTDGAHPIHVEGKNTKIRTIYWRVLDFDGPTGTRTVSLDAIVGVK